MWSAEAKEQGPSSGNVFGVALPDQIVQASRQATSSKVCISAFQTLQYLVIVIIKIIEIICFLRIPLFNTYFNKSASISTCYLIFSLCLVIIIFLSWSSSYPRPHFFMITVHCHMEAMTRSCKFCKIQALSLPKKNLSEVPPAAWEAGPITTLDLTHNQIKVLPTELSMCSTLEVRNS